MVFFKLLYFLPLKKHILSTNNLGESIYDLRVLGDIFSDDTIKYAPRE